MMTEMTERTNTAIKIDSHALYPREGLAVAARAPQTNYSKPYGQPWPAISVGQTVLVLDSQGWLWTAEILSIESSEPGTERAQVQIIGERAPSPMPPIVDGCITLPNVSGHAHARRWGAGDVVLLGEQYYQVKGKPRPSDAAHSKLVYRLAPVDRAKYETRPGLVRMSDERTARAAVGSVIETATNEWLHVLKVEKQTHRSSEGEYFGTTWCAIGKHVSAVRAARINDTHGPTLSRALSLSGKRVATLMPADAAMLVPRDTTSMAASGERIAIVDGVLLHERCGDPDMVDSWHRYVVQIDDHELIARAKRYIARTKK